MNINYQLILVLLLFSAISYINGLFAINLVNSIRTQPTLPDIGFSILPQISAMYPNMLFIISFIYFCFRFIRRDNIDALIKLLWCMTILFTLRLITFTVTTVPPATTFCYARNDNSTIEWNVFNILLSKDDNTCIDYMFSGHTIYFMILLLFVLNFSQSIVEKIFCSIHTLFSILSIISGRIHYTVDVVVAIIITTGCYYIFVYKNGNKHSLNPN